jgi:hypothetical protein
MSTGMTTWPPVAPVEKFRRIDGRTMERTELKFVRDHYSDEVIEVYLDNLRIGEISYEVHGSEGMLNAQLLLEAVAEHFSWDIHHE